MGDCRYYTLDQFFSIIYLTMIIIFIVYYTVLNLYKASGNKLIKKIIISNIILFLIVLLNFFEQIIVKEQSALHLKLIASMLFIMMNILFINFILNLLIANMFYKKLTIIFNILMFLSIASGFFNNEFFVKRYTFNHITYGSIYSILLAICFLMHLFLVCLLVKSKNKWFFNKKQLVFAIIFFWLMPTTLYFATILINAFNFKIIEYIMYLLISIGYSITLGLFLPFRVSSSIFSNVQGLMLDYVFIVDAKGNIIYKNQDVVQSEFFKKAKSVNIDDITELFNNEIMLRQAYNIQFIKYLNNDSTFFSYNKKEIFKGQKLAGYILTFTNITTLIKMLDKLKFEQKETEKVNKKLSQYKDIVYELEKEKEINLLLSEIANNQQKAMLELKISIDKLKENIDNHYTENLSKIIKKAKYNLNDVRSAVTAYIDYYNA